MSKRHSSFPRLYKSHMHSRNKQKSVYNKKSGNDLLFSDLESKIERIHVLTAEE